MNGIDWRGVGKTAVIAATVAAAETVARELISKNIKRQPRATRQKSSAPKNAPQG